MSSSPVDLLVGHDLTGALATGSPVVVTAGDHAGVLEALSAVPDPRARRGVRHGFASVLAIAVCATLCGARSYAAIAEWAADLPAQHRAGLGMRGRAPNLVTIWRILIAVDPLALDRAIGTWIAARLAAITPGRVRRVVAVDGKTLRGAAAGTDGRAVHLMAAVDHHRSVVLGQVNVDAKTNEIPLFGTLLNQLEDLTGVLVTADALHAQRGHASYLHSRGGHYLVTVKGNQPNLRNQLRALPWTQVPVGHTAAGRAHGRQERRTLKAVTVPAGLAFPHAAQALQITRQTRRHGGRKWRTEVVYAICSLPAEHAQPAQLAAWIRGHWTIENRLHWVRDVTFGEDLSQVRTGHGPHVMAALRNLAISILRLTGHTNIARALRHTARKPDRAIHLATTTATTTQ